MIEIKVSEGVCRDGWERIVIKRDLQPKEGECVLRRSGEIVRYTEGMMDVEGVIIETRKPFRSRGGVGR